MASPVVSNSSSPSKRVRGHTHNPYAFSMELKALKDSNSSSQLLMISPGSNSSSTRTPEHEHITTTSGMDHTSEECCSSYLGSARGDSTSGAPSRDEDILPEPYGDRTPQHHHHYQQQQNNYATQFPSPQSYSYHHHHEDSMLLSMPGCFPAPPPPPMNNGVLPPALPVATAALSITTGLPAGLPPRNKSVVCRRFILGGNCDKSKKDINDPSCGCTLGGVCPFRHVSATHEEPMPRSICKFHQNGACLRDVCPFFHGTAEQLQELLSYGAPMYRPAEVCVVRDAEGEAAQGPQGPQQAQIELPIAPPQLPLFQAPPPHVMPQQQQQQQRGGPYRQQQKPYHHRRADYGQQQQFYPPPQF